MSLSKHEVKYLVTLSFAKKLASDKTHVHHKNNEITKEQKGATPHAYLRLIIL